MNAVEWLFCKAIEDITFTSTLDAIGQQIKEIWKGVENGDEHACGIAQEIEETLVGAATVICQAKILRVVKAAQFDPECRKKIRDVECDHVLRGLGEKAGTSNLSKVEILWHMGNYFKHAEEWARARPPNWPSEDKYKHTVDAITAGGLDPKKSYGDNVLLGAKFLGVLDAGDLSAFSEIVNNWSKVLLNRAYPKHC